MIQMLALKIGLALAIVAGACGATWFAADSHYSNQYAALKAGYEQASRDQKAQVDRTIADNQAAAKAVNDEASQQIGSMARTIADLSVRASAPGSRAITVRACPTSTPVATVQPDRSAVAASPGPAAESAKPVATVDPAILSGIIDVSIDAIRAELLWRQWVKSTRQVP